MKTVKEVSEITGISIRALRYYDEIGLLNPSQLTEAGYRLYDNKSLETLQQIMFFRELEIPLINIKEIMENSNYDKKQILLTQKSVLENKRNRLNGIIELIKDVMKGDNTMNFEAFNDDDVQKTFDHMVECMSKEDFDMQTKKYGGVEKYRDHLAEGLIDNKASVDLIRWYGSKEKAVNASLEPVANFSTHQDENAEIYKQLMQAKKIGDDTLEKEAVSRLAALYKIIFHMDNARNMLLDLAKEYLSNDKLAESNDNIYGKGSSEYIANAINRYYGI